MPHAVTLPFKKIPHGSDEFLVDTPHYATDGAACFDLQAADGRGLDIEARAQDGRGFRFSLAPARTSLTSVLSASTEFTRADNVSTRNYRFAVSNDKVLVYSDQEYIGSTSLAMIGDIQADDCTTIGCDDHAITHDQCRRKAS